MASETVTLTEICTGGEHLTFTLTGAKAATVQMALTDLAAEVTDADIEAYCKVIAKLVKIGRNNTQTKNALQNGVTVSV